MRPGLATFYLANGRTTHSIHVSNFLLDKTLFKQIANLNNLFFFQHSLVRLFTTMRNVAVHMTVKVHEILDAIVQLVFVDVMGVMFIWQGAKKGARYKNMNFDASLYSIRIGQVNGNIPFMGRSKFKDFPPLKHRTLARLNSPIQTPHPSGIAHLIQPFVSRHVLPNLITHDMRSNRKRPTQSTSTICQDVRKSKLNGAFVSNYNTTTTRLGNSHYTLNAPMKQVFYPTIQGAST